MKFPQPTSKPSTFLCSCFRENARAKEKRKDVTALDPTETRTGFSQDTQRGGSVVYMPIGLN